MPRRQPGGAPMGADVALQPAITLPGRRPPRPRLPSEAAHHGPVGPGPSRPPGDGIRPAGQGPQAGHVQIRDPRRTPTTNPPRRHPQHLGQNFVGQTHRLQQLHVRPPIRRHIAVRSDSGPPKLDRHSPRRQRRPVEQPRTARPRPSRDHPRPSCLHQRRARRTRQHARRRRRHPPHRRLHQRQPRPASLSPPRTSSPKRPRRTGHRQTTP
jgi:hypothetical protein